MKVFLLCAGVGSRMIPYSQIGNKSLLRIGGIPVARVITDRIKDDRICKGNDIFVVCRPIDFKDFQHEFRDTSIRTAITDSNVNKGTVGDFMEAFNSCFKYKDVLTGLQEGDDIMIHYGDVITNVNYGMMMKFWENHKNSFDLMLVGNNNIRHDYSKITVVDQLDVSKPKVISRFVEKPLLEDTGWTGIMVFQYSEDKGFFPFVRAKYETADKLDFGYDIFSEFIPEGTTLLYTPLEDGVRWYDAGNIRSFETLRAHFAEGRKSPRNAYDY